MDDLPSRLSLKMSNSWAKLDILYNERTCILS